MERDYKYYYFIIRGNVIPEALPDRKKPQFKQEVVKLELVHEDVSLSTKVNETMKTFENHTNTLNPAVEIVLENATVRFFHGIDQQLVETMLNCLGGVIHAR